MLQTDLLLRDLITIVVAPLERAQLAQIVDRLNPKVQVEGQAFIVITQGVVAVRRSVLGSVQGSVAREREAIIRALDLPFTGF